MLISINLTISSLASHCGRRPASAFLLKPITQNEKKTQKWKGKAKQRTDNRENTSYIVGWHTPIIQLMSIYARLLLKFAVYKFPRGVTLG